MAEERTDYFWDDDEKLKRYKARLAWAKNDQSDFRSQADIYLSYYRNKNKVFTRGGQKVIVPRAIKNVDAMQAALTAFDVWPVVVPKGLTTLDMAEVQQQALRLEWEEQEVLNTAEYAIKESLIVGIGYVKVGYEYEEEMPTEEEQDDEVAMELSENPDATPEAAFAQAAEPVPIKDNVVVDHVPYDEVYFDPEAKKWDDLRWIAHAYEVPLEEVMDDETIPDARKENLKRDTVVNPSWREAAGQDGKDVTADEERVVLIEMYDLVKGTTCTFTEGHDEILKEVPNPYALRRRLKDRNPFVPYVTRTDIGKVIGISDVQVMKPSIDEENVLRSGLATFVDRMKPKLLAEEGIFGDQAKKALRSQEWGEVVELRQGAILGNSFKPMEFPSLPPEAFTQDAKAAYDADSSIGLNEILQGQLPSGRKSATGMQIMANASSIRQSEKRNHLNRFYMAIADRMLYLMKLLYDQERIVRMVEDYGDIVWTFDANDIAFESGVGVEIEQKEILDTEAKREKFMALLNILGGDPTVDGTELKKYVLRNIGIPAEVIRKLIKSPEQMQAEQQAAMQTTANQAVAEQGITPPPENIPGPLPGSALVAAANEGETPQG